MGDMTKAGDILAPIKRDDPATLAQRLINVAAKVARVPKRGWNDFGKYHYATESDVTDAIREALIENSVLLEQSIDDVTSMDGKKSAIVITKHTFTFRCAVTGQTQASVWFGAGSDSGDKALYKAYTGAMKTFLLKRFLIPTGDDPEDEKPEKPARQTTPSSATPMTIRVSSVIAKRSEETGEEIAPWRFVVEDEDQTVFLTYRVEDATLVRRAIVNARGLVTASIRVECLRRDDNGGRVVWKVIAIESVT